MNIQKNNTEDIEELKKNFNEKTLKKSMHFYVSTFVVVAPRVMRCSNTKIWTKAP